MSSVMYLSLVMRVLTCNKGREEISKSNTFNGYTRINYFVIIMAISTLNMKLIRAAAYGMEDRGSISGKSKSLDMPRDTTCQLSKGYR
jgi:hypothetical protein